MAYIGVQPTDTYLSIASQQITGNGGATYTLDYSVSDEESVAVFVNNVRQNVSSYTVSSNQLTLGGTISASDSCWVLFLGRTVGTKTPAVGSVTNAMLAGSISPSKVSNLYPYRNLIINGDMSIAQRGTSSTGITSNGYYTIDRFRTTISTLGTWTQSQSTDVPSGQGFSNSLKMECTTADASPSAGDNLLLYHYVEAQNCQHLKFGTSNAESLTLSFWVKSNKTGTLTQNIRQIDGGKFINNSYTINSANTWEKKTLNFVGNTADVIDNDNGAGFQIEWWLDSGSDFRGGTPSSSWHTQNNLDRNADSTISLADTVGNTWYITGVQLEVGTSASDFEFLPFDVNLQRCERYYEKSYTVTTAPGTDTEAGSISLNGLNESSKQVRTHDTRYTTQKRSSPTITIYDKTGNSGKFSTFNSGGARADNVSYNGIITTNQNSFDLYKSSTTIAGYQFHYTADAEL